MRTGCDHAHRGQAWESLTLSWVRVITLFDLIRMQRTDMAGFYETAILYSFLVVRLGLSVAEAAVNIGQLAVLTIPFLGSPALCLVQRNPALGAVTSLLDLSMVLYLLIRFMVYKQDHWRAFVRSLLCRRMGKMTAVLLWIVAAFNSAIGSGTLPAQCVQFANRRPALP